MDDKQFNVLKIFSVLIVVLLVTVVTMGYFLFKKDNSDVIKELKRQNIELSHKIDSVNTVVSGKIDSIKVIKAKSTNTQTIYQKDVYHVWTTEDKDSVAAIIRAQLDKLKRPIID